MEPVHSQGRCRWLNGGITNGQELEMRDCSILDAAYVERDVHAVCFSRRRRPLTPCTFPMARNARWTDICYFQTLDWGHGEPAMNRSGCPVYLRDAPERYAGESRRSAQSMTQKSANGLG